MCGPNFTAFTLTVMLAVTISSFRPGLVSSPLRPAVSQSLRHGGFAIGLSH
jgi:hypothetical protein